MKVLLIIFIPFFLSAETLKLDYAAAKEQLFAQNREILQAAQSVAEAEGKLTEASSGYLPKFSLSGSYNYMSAIPAMQISLPGPINKIIQTGANDNWAFKASVNQTLFDWGRMFLVPELAGKGLEASNLELEQVKTQALLGLNQTFYSVLLSKKIVETNEESFKLAEENLRQAEARLKTGTSPAFDLLRAKVRLSNIKPLVVKSKNNYELALQNLKSILGLPLAQEINIAGDFKDAEEKGLESGPGEFVPALKKALAGRVEIKKAKAKKEMAEASAALSLTYDKPLLSGSLSYNYQNPYVSQLAWVESWNAGLFLSIPIFDGFSTAGKTKSAQAVVKAAEISKTQTENMVELDVKQTLLNMNEASDRIISQADSVKQAEEYYKIAETSYSSGVNTNYEVMDAHLSLLTARTAYFQALYDLTVAKAAFLKATGELR